MTRPVPQSTALGVGYSEPTTFSSSKMDSVSSSAMSSSAPLFTSSAQIWKSRLSWRITLAVFLTIMTVQATILALTLKDYQQKQLDLISQLAKSSLVPAVTDQTSPFESPIESSVGNKIIAHTVISGMAIYGGDLTTLALHGEPVRTVLSTKTNLNSSYQSADGKIYEVIFRPKDLQGKQYYIVARMDSTQATNNAQHYVYQSILIMFLLSAFVTAVLMVALGRWLLEPILFLRDNLKSASSNPESPKIMRSPYSPLDEIGGAIDLAQNLIRQNAENLRKTKSSAQNQIHKLAYFDQTTGLPNRTLFIKKLQEFTQKSGSLSGQRVAVVAMDLDHFKDINDSMGHNVGDAILRGVGKRLRSALPESAIVARSGEDEFAVFMPLSSDINSAKDIAERVIGVMRAEPFKVFNEAFQVRGSIGVATWPDNGIDPDSVLKNADIALNRAKEEGRDTIREYLEDFDRAVQQRFQMLRDLRDALENDQLSLNFQPQFDLRTGQIIGAEALIRWWKPDASKEGGSFISPGIFVPIAEQSGLIVPIGEWVMKKACETAASWHKAGIPIRIAVNVSGAQFHQSDIVAFTSKVLRDTAIPPHMLELEVTESVFMDDITQTIKTLQELHGLGVEIAIDDFGTGYSSLSYLRQFPIDRLKIDQSFIKNALNNSDDAAIARTIIRLANSLGLKVIAEGVETADHEKFLIQEGCDEVQGFRYSRPIPNEKFLTFAQGYSGQLSTFG